MLGSYVLLIAFDIPGLVMCRYSKRQRYLNRENVNRMTYANMVSIKGFDFFDEAWLTIPSYLFKLAIQKSAILIFLL